MTMTARLSLLAKFLTRLINSPVPGNQFQLLADYAPQILPADFLAIALVDTQPGRYIIHPLRGTAGAAIPRRPFSFDDGLAGSVMRASQTRLVRDISELEPFNPETEGVLQRFGIQSLLVAPVLQGEQPLGALILGSKSLNGYDEPELSLINHLAEGMAEGLANARHYQLLADEHSMLEAVLRSSRDAVLLFNMQGIVLMANPAVQEMLAIREEALIGHSVTATGNEALIHLFEENQAGMVDVTLADGRTAQAQLVPVQTAFSETVGWAAILRDVTVYKELEQMKSDFVNTVSHDLKNPITSIVLGANLIRQAGPLNELQTEVTGRLLNTADYMQQLVTDLLDLGKIEAGLDLAQESLNLVQLAYASIDPLKPQIEKKNQRLSCNFVETAMVVGDGSWLRHVMTNLISNASKYTPDNGNILVRLAPAEGQHGFVLSVMDDGLGIPAGDLPHIFDKFFRSQTKATSKISGTGLGLAMAKSIIQAHGGYIWAESEEAKGSTFAFYLPGEEVFAAD